MITKFKIIVNNSGIFMSTITKNYIWKSGLGNQANYCNGIGGKEREAAIRRHKKLKFT